MQTTPERPQHINQNQSALRRYRRLKGLEQSELAKQVGTSQSHISGIETGKRIAGVKLLHRIAEVLDCSVEELLAE